MISTASPPESADTSAHPYHQLTPDRVLDALAGIGLVGDGRLQALSSYENRVYRVWLDPAWQGCTSVVVKFYRPGRWHTAQLIEEQRFALELQAAEVPVVAPLLINGAALHHFAGFYFSVCPQWGGRQPELDDVEVLEWLGRFLARLHNVGARTPFVQRPALDLASFGLASRELLLQQHLIPLDVQGRWLEACNQAIELIAIHPALTSAIGQNDGQNRAIARIRLHGDCHPGNILWTPPGPDGGGPHLVDLDDARSAPAVQDLWMLLSGGRAERSAQLSALLDGYEQLRAFDRRELVLIEPLRTLRLIHYSAWLAQRWHDPIFPIHFPWFGSSDYWQEQVQLLQDQIEAMQTTPLSV